MHKPGKVWPAQNLTRNIFYQYPEVKDDSYQEPGSTKIYLGPFNIKNPENHIAIIELVFPLLETRLVGNLLAQDNTVETGHSHQLKYLNSFFTILFYLLFFRILSSFIYIPVWYCLEHLKLQNIFTCYFLPKSRAKQRHGSAPPPPWAWVANGVA